jgi:cytochrome c-type biogenesis protein CcmH
MTIAILVALALLMLFGIVSFKRKESNLAENLRKLLLARSSGEITSEQFEHEQASLYAQALQTQVVSNKGKVLQYGIAGLLLAVAIGLYLSDYSVPSASSTATATVSNALQLPSLGDKAELSAMIKDKSQQWQSAGVNQPLAGQASGQHGSKKNEGGDLKVLAKRLAEKMEQDPNNGEGWLLLARTYRELHMHPEAAAAYQKASNLVTPTADLFADWVDAYVMSRQGNWDDTARTLLKRGLAADKNHLKALALAGSEAFDRSDYKVAIRYWQHMKEVAPAESMYAKLADANMNEAKSKETIVKR